MSLYNMINGYNPAVLWILPMLGKHPDAYPRFRDCFVDDGKIVVFTRTGGGNREEYEDRNQEIRNMPGFVTDYDDDYDCTFARWVFEVPSRWVSDFHALTGGEKPHLPSKEYREEIVRVFPKLKDHLESAWAKAEENEKGPK